MLVKIWKGFYALWGCSTIRDIRNMKTLVRVSGEVFVRRESTVRVAPNYWKEVGGDEHWLLTVVSLLVTRMWSFAMESKHQPRLLWFEVLLVILRVPFPLLNKFIITGCCILLSVWNGVLSHFWQWQSKQGWNFFGSPKSYVLERSTRISFVFSSFNIFGWKCCCFLPLWMKNSVICRGSFALETESWFNQQELWTCKLGLRHCYKNYWKKGPNIKAEEGIICCAADHDGSSNAVLCIGKMFCVMKTQVIQGCVFRKLEIIEKQSHHTGLPCFRNYVVNTLNN